MKRAVISQLREILGHYREHGLKKTLAWFHSKDAPVIIQLGKYVVAGGMATVATMGTWMILCFTVLPAFSIEEIEQYRSILAKIHIDLPHYKVETLHLSDTVRASHSTYANILGWVFGNLVAYVVNALWVFEGGRHNRWLEFIYFTLVSGFSTLIGLMAGPFLIKVFGISTGVSQLSFLVTAVLVNYVCRKYFVFAK
ncbi:MAG: GtrA family protein [Verrucomicrobiae bacterium]|nr:GtrA family protein [Verrucomicrobiae bacterium]